MASPVLRITVASLLALSACGGSDTGGPLDGGAPDAGPGTPDAGPDRTGELFDPDHIVEVVIDMDPGDFDVLRHQTRTIFDILSGDCLGQPFASPFTTFPADITIDGTTVADVGIHKKGFLGSLESERPGLKVKFDEYVTGQSYLGLERFTLNNARQDPSHLHTCLAYEMFTRAGLVAPRCNFAHVTVNGEDLGLYMDVESVDKKFLARHFADNTGNLYEGTLSDFRPDWQATFDLKTNETANDRTDIGEMVTALAASDAALPGALDPLVDLDEYTRFWATEVLIGHWDGYDSNTNNFFLYDDPSDGRFRFLPWGADAVFEPQTTYGTTGLKSVAAVGILARRLYQIPAMRDAYEAQLQDVLATAWDEDALLAEVDRMHDLILPYDGSTTWENAVDEIRVYIMTRRNDIVGELAVGPPAWTDPLRDPPCFAPIGDASGSFSTTWGTIGSPNPWATGTGTLDMTIDGQHVTPAPVGATAGFEQMPDDPARPRAQVTLIGAIGDGTYAVVIFLVDQSFFTPGSPSLDFGAGLGVIYRYNPATSAATVMGILVGPGLTLTQASTAASAPVSGSFSMTVTRWPF